MFKTAPIYIEAYPDLHFNDVKDPCMVFDGEKWHLFTSGGWGPNHGGWQVTHMISENMHGPFRLHSTLNIMEGSCVAAPGVVYHKGLFYMTIQTGYQHLGESIFLTTSKGDGVWTEPKMIIGGLDHMCCYDAHISFVDDEMVVVYASYDERNMHRPNLYVSYPMRYITFEARHRIKLLDCDDVKFHNAHYHHDYEWGLEGPQVLDIPGVGMLLTFVAFLGDRPRGQRQRLCFALASYKNLWWKILPPVVDPPENGENGHGMCFEHEGKFYCVLQERYSNYVWRPAITEIDLKTLKAAEPA